MILHQHTLTPRLMWAQPNRNHYIYIYLYILRFDGGPYFTDDYYDYDYDDGDDFYMVIKNKATFRLRYNSQNGAEVRALRCLVLQRMFSSIVAV